MGANAHGVSPKKIRKPTPKTKKRLAVKAARKAAQGVKGKKKRK
jgi:pyrroloquinoline quinone (PQQ) biosynthesis protein C